MSCPFINPFIYYSSHIQFINMKRTKHLVFRTYQSFQEWYTRMANRFTKLRLEFLKVFRSSHYIAVSISY